MASSSKENSKATGEFTALLASKMTMTEDMAFEKLLEKYPLLHLRYGASQNSLSRSESSTANLGGGDDAEEEEEDEEPSSKARKIDEDGKKAIKDVSEACKKWEREHTKFAVENLVDMAMQGHKAGKSFKAPALKQVVELVNKEFKTRYGVGNLQNHLKFLKKRWKDIIWLMKQKGAGWDQEQKKIVFAEDLAKTYIKEKSLRKNYINVSLPYDLQQLRIVCGVDHAEGLFKKSGYESLGNKEQPVMIDGESSNTGNDPALHEKNEDPNESGKKQSEKQSKGPSSGKRQKEDVASAAVEKFVECLHWFGQAIITAHTQDHAQNILKELNTVIMSTPGEYSRSDLDNAYMFVAKNEHYARIFLAKPRDIQMAEVGVVIEGLKNGKLRP